MRRTTATLALLGTLALTGCATSTPSGVPTSTGTAVAPASAPTDLLDCSPVLKRALDAKVFDADKCWTSADLADAAMVRGGTVFSVVKSRTTQDRFVVARDAADGKKLWSSPALEGVATIDAKSIQVHDFSARGTDAVAVGYKAAGDTYRVVVLDPESGEEISRGDSKTRPAEITWGAGAVALKGYRDEVSILTVSGGGFKDLPGLPWDSVAAAGSASKPMTGNHVLYVTEDRLVLDKAAAGSAGAVITDAAGGKVASLPGGAGMPAASFCGDFGIVDARDGSAPVWVGLADGLPVGWPGCMAGTYFPSGDLGQDFGVRRMGSDSAAVSPDGKWVFVAGAGIYSTSDAKVLPMKEGFGIFGASNSMAFGPAANYSLTTGETIAHQSSAVGVGVSDSDGSAAAVFSGAWGIGGAPVR